MLRANLLDVDLGLDPKLAAISVSSALVAGWRVM